MFMVGEFMKFSNTKEKFSFLFKLLILVVCGIGLYLNFKIGSLWMILYFTLLSNLMCFLFYLFAIILKLCNKLEKNNIYYVFKGMITMAITLTMFGYWLLVASGGDIGIYASHMTSCRIVHLYVPILVMLDYLIFGEKGNLKKSYPFIWSTVVIGYGIFTSVYSFFGGLFLGNNKYPYNYLNIEEFGVIKVCINCLVIYITYVVYGVIIQKIDKLLGKENK